MLGLVAREPNRPEPVVSVASSAAGRSSDTAEWNAQRTDPFLLAVPEAGLDVILLFHKARPMMQVMRFQTLLRALCAMRRSVSRAAMMEDRIELQVDEVRMVLGDATPIGGQGQGFRRPDFENATRQAPRLGYFMRHHAFALRMRIGSPASAELIADICQLLLQMHPPSALILTGPRLVLCRAEFEHALAIGLDRLRPGPPLPDMRQRYTRPMATCPAAFPSAFSGAHGNQSVTPLHRAERITARLCAARDDQDLARVFRDDGGPAASTQDFAPLCDAVMLRCRRSAIAVLAPLLAATLVLTAQTSPPPGPTAQIHQALRV